VQTFELTATVVSMDKASRKVTLVSPEGIKKTVNVGPEAINFDQVRVGDQLKVTVAEEIQTEKACFEPLWLPTSRWCPKPGRNDCDDRDAVGRSGDTSNINQQLRERRGTN
jgi:hypothetical protein